MFGFQLCPEYVPSTHREYFHYPTRTYKRGSLLNEYRKIKAMAQEKIKIERKEERLNRKAKKSEKANDNLSKSAQVFEKQNSDYNLNATNTKETVVTGMSEETVVKNILEEIIVKSISEETVVTSIFEEKVATGMSEVIIETGVPEERINNRDENIREYINSILNPKVETKDYEIFEQVYLEIIHDSSSLPSDGPLYHKKLWHLEKNILPKLHKLTVIIEKLERHQTLKNISNLNIKLDECKKLIKNDFPVKKPPFMQENRFSKIRLFVKCQISGKNIFSSNL